MCAAVLFLEAIVVGLSAPVMIAVDDVSTPVALSVGLGLAVVCLLLSGMLRKEWAYTAGWVVQVAAIATGFLVTLMFFLGLVFGGLWATAYLLGRRIEREKAAAYAAFDAQQQTG
jgi:Sec-independent protein secretion pathway component TatC